MVENLDQRWPTSGRMMLRRLLRIWIPASAVLRQAFKLLWTEADRLAKLLVAVTLLLVLVTSVITALAPVVLKVIIDRLESDQTHSGYIAMLYLISAYALTHWLARSLGELRSMFHGRTDQRLQKKLSQRLFQHTMSLPLRSHLERKTGAVAQTLSNGLIGYRMVLHHLMLTLIPVVVELATMGAVLLFLDHVVFLAIVGVFVILYALAFKASVVHIGRAARDVSNDHIEMYAVLTDSFLNYETVKYFGAEAQMHERFGATLARTERSWRKLYRRKTENGLLIATIFALSLGVSVYVAARGVQQNDMAIGDFVLVNVYILQITRPLELIGLALRDSAQGMAFIEKMGELLNEEREDETANDHTFLSANRAALSFEQVSFSYRSTRWVLKDVNFIVPSGKTFAFVGASGSGKSTLIRLLMRLVEPSEGQIFLNGVPLSHISLSVLRSSVAVVPQDTALFNDSIAYNISLSRQNSTAEEIIGAAKIARIHDFIAGLPDGYETKVGERGLKLSGGERQRIAIARAVLKKPKIFVFDEATSSLDSKTERAILCDLIEIARETTTLIIAHRLSTIAHADEIILLDHGTVAGQGTHGVLLQTNDAYAALWNEQHFRMSPSTAGAPDVWRPLVESGQV